MWNEWGQCRRLCNFVDYWPVNGGSNVFVSVRCSMTYMLINDPFVEPWAVD